MNNAEKKLVRMSVFKALEIFDRPYMTHATSGMFTAIVAIKGQEEITEDQHGAFAIDVNLQNGHIEISGMEQECAEGFAEIFRQEMKSAIKQKVVKEKAEALKAAISDAVISLAKNADEEKTSGAAVH